MRETQRYMQQNIEEKTKIIFILGVVGNINRIGFISCFSDLLILKFYFRLIDFKLLAAFCIHHRGGYLTLE